jgi:hypothetical protein
MLLKGERKLANINAGKIVKDANINLPNLVILCVVPHMSHFIGL